MQNMFCVTDDLRNEADVEALFVEPLIQLLGFPNNRIRRRTAIETLPIPRGSNVEQYTPDYVLFDSSGKPVVVIDAKHPDENPSAYRYQVCGYAHLINQRYDDNPVRYCVVSNGLRTELLEWDRQNPVLEVRFQDFDSGNELFTALRSSLGYEAFNQQLAVRDVRPSYRRPSVATIIAAFAAAHDTIWKKEKMGPTKAFYELAKLLFVKLRQDRSIHEKIAGGGDRTTTIFTSRSIGLRANVRPTR